MTTNPDDAEFELCRSFGIDNGELDELDRANCFVLGYELCQIDELLKQLPAIARPVHAANQDRIRKACEQAGREYTLTWMNTDRSETWMWLEVERIKRHRGYAWRD